MIVDAHQHFWALSRGDYGFPSPTDPILYRDFMPDDLMPLMDRAGVRRSVLVQATDTIEETDFLLRLAAGTPFVAGVVGWWDPRADGLLDRLLALPNAGGLVGVRPMLQKSDDVTWLVADDALHELARIAEHGLAFDALVDARHLEVVATLCRSLPELSVVIDHLGKPWRKPALTEQWMHGMRALAVCPNCMVKISGFPFAQLDLPLDAGSLVARLREWFGTERLVWGSDWPVVERESNYGDALASMQELFSTEQRAAVFGENAVALYRLNVERQDWKRIWHLSN
jgi:L-fuconolactonase